MQWFDKISREMRELEENTEINFNTRLEKVSQLISNYEQNKDRASSLEEKSK
jgi:hypothetical protein